MEIRELIVRKDEMRLFISEVDYTDKRGIRQNVLEGFALLSIRKSNLRIQIYYRKSRICLPSLP